MTLLEEANLAIELISEERASNCYIYDRNVQELEECHEADAGVTVAETFDFYF